MRTLPGGDEWLRRRRAGAPTQRHLAVHTGHCVELEAAGRRVARRRHSMLKDVTLSGTRDEIAALEATRARGDRVVFQPCGPGIRGELERFLDTARG